MTDRELRKEFDNIWRKENQALYTVRLICYFADLIPLIVMVMQFSKGVNDKTVGTMVVCLAILLVISLISMVITLKQNKDYKAYREKNRDRLK